MSDQRCPGQDRRRWRPEDLTEVVCEGCGARLEFWPDEMMRTCAKCRRRVSNPRLNLRCLEWCAAAEQCLEQIRSAGVSLEEAKEFVRRRDAKPAPK